MQKLRKGTELTQIGNLARQGRTKPLIFLLVALTCFALNSSGQGKVFTYDTCLRLTIQNYPLTKQKDYLLNIDAETRKELNGQWLPQLSVNSTATLFSEVTSFSLPGFGQFASLFPPIYKDQYNLGIEVHQTIFDGGVTSQEKKMATANSETEIEKNEVELYKVKGRVLQLYAGILLAHENLKVAYSYLDDLSSRRAALVSSVNSGTMLQSNVDAIDVEILNAGQKIIEAQSALNGYCSVLSLLLHVKVDTAAAFAGFTASNTPLSDSVKRPEMKLFGLEQNLIEEKMILANRKEMPQLSLFGSGDYGRPGYNFLDQNFRFYGMAGLSLNWNITGLYRLHYDKEVLSINKKMIDTRKDDFLLQTNSAMAQQNNEISKLHQLIDNDKAIVEKRKAISKTAASRLDNGTLTSSDYIMRLTEEKQAILNQKMHEIALDAAYISYRITTGN